MEFLEGTYSRVYRYALARIGEKRPPIKVQEATKRIALGLFVVILFIGCSGEVSPLSDVAKSKAASAEFCELLDASMEELRLKTEAHDATWHIGEAAWSVDQDAGKIDFVSPNGLTATAPVQIIGTFNTADNYVVVGLGPPLRYAKLERTCPKKVKEYGEKHGIAVLTTRKSTARKMRRGNWALWHANSARLREPIEVRQTAHEL